MGKFFHHPKGSPAARAHMARLRAMRGKKKNPTISDPGGIGEKPRKFTSRGAAFVRSTGERSGTPVAVEGWDYGVPLGTMVGTHSIAYDPASGTKPGYYPGHGQWGGPLDPSVTPRRGNPKDRRDKKLEAAAAKGGVSIVYLPANQAYMVMWHDQRLAGPMPYSAAADYVRSILPRAENPQLLVLGNPVYPHASGAVRFKDLPTGSTFIFESEATMPLWTGARGPWVKTGSRTYRHLDQTIVHWQNVRVGSVNVRVVRVNPANPQPPPFRKGKGRTRPPLTPGQRKDIEEMREEERWRERERREDEAADRARQGNPGPRPKGVPPWMWADPAFHAEVKAFRRRHGPRKAIVISKVKVPKGYPKFMSVYGRSNHTVYDAPPGSNKGKRIHHFGKRGKGRPWLASSASRGPKFLAYVGGSFKARHDWIYD